MDDMATTGIMVAAYLRSLHVRRVSENTVKQARSTLTTLERIIGKECDYATAEDLRRWQEQRAQTLTARSLRTNVSVVQTAYRWAAAEGVIRQDPAARLRPPRCGQTLPRPIPEDRLVAAYEAADQRMRVMLCLAAWASLRCCEIAALAWADVYLGGEPYIHVLGKGRHERAIALSPELAAELEALPNRRGPVIRRADGLPGHNSANRVSKMMNDHLRACGAPDTAHSLRHRALTEACRFGGVKHAQDLAGHSSPAVTGIYVKVLQSDLRPTVLAIGRFHPERAAS